MTDTGEIGSQLFLSLEHRVNENMSGVACSQALYSWFSQTFGACAALGNQIRKEHDNACSATLSAPSEGNAL